MIIPMSYHWRNAAIAEIYSNTVKVMPIVFTIIDFLTFSTLLIKIWNQVKFLLENIDDGECLIFG